MRVMIVDDEEIKRVTLGDRLKRSGHVVADFRDAESGLAQLDRDRFDVVVTDLRMPGMDGLAFLKEIKRRDPRIDVVVMTAYGTVESAVEAVRAGAYDYIQKPFPSDALVLLLQKIESYRSVLAENVLLRTEVESRYRFGNIVGRSEAMKRVYQRIQRVADSDSTVLISGESGTGKELVANAIHYNSPRRERPLVKVSCASLAETLLESELFGHERGAFTGAVRERTGRFEAADYGTLFLDEVDDIPAAMQVKLLRVLQERELERVGGSRTIRVDVRVIAATKVDLESRVKAGTFREDFFYRLNVVPIELPPLRARREDIPLLIEHFVEKHGGRGDGARRRISFSRETLARLMEYHWPGNVRELENLVERLVLLAEGSEVVPADLPARMVLPPGADVGPMMSFDESSDQISFEGVMDAMEQRLLSWALKVEGGNKARAARRLGLKRSTFRDKLVKHFGEAAGADEEEPVADDTPKGRAQ